MKRLFIAALVVVAVGAIAGTALAANAIKSSVIYNSTTPNGPATNLPSYGPEAYAFKTIGDSITFGGTARSLTNVTVTLSSWACEQGSWNGNDCVTQSGATFSQPIRLTVRDETGAVVATSTKTFDVPYRPSASPKCTDGKWLSPKDGCKNGLANDVTFNFSNVTLPATVVYEISYDTNNYGTNPQHVAGPSDSLNVALTDSPSVGISTDTNIWIDGTEGTTFGSYTPAVQFKAGNGS